MDNPVWPVVLLLVCAIAIAYGVRKMSRVARAAERESAIREAILEDEIAERLDAIASAADAARAAKRDVPPSQETDATLPVLPAAAGAQESTTVDHSADVNASTEASTVASADEGADASPESDSSVPPAREDDIMADLKAFQSAFPP